jgi:hypothetical protein
MKPEPGPNQHCGDRAARRALELGLRGAKAQLLVRHATHGNDGCFNTTRELSQAEDIRRADGQPYHPEHIGRCNRELARAGLLVHTRIAPGKKPNRLAERRSSHGTTLNVINWAVLFGKRRPTFRGEKRKVAAELRKNCPPSAPRPRHAFVPFTPPPGLVEHAQRTGRDVDRAEKPGRDGRDGMTPAELLAAVEQAKRAMDDPGSTGPPE